MTLLDQWRKEDSSFGIEDEISVALEAQPENKNTNIDSKDLAKSLGIPREVVIKNPFKADVEKTSREIRKDLLLKNFVFEDKVHEVSTNNDENSNTGFFSNLYDSAINEGQAISRAWETGVVQLKNIKLGYQLLQGNTSVLAESEELLKGSNPYWEQDLLGLTVPSNASNTVHNVAASPYIHNVNGQAILLPSIDASGEPISKEEAEGQFLAQGTHLGIFNSQDAAANFIALNQEEQERIQQNFKKKPDTFTDSGWGLAESIQQIPRMLEHDIPTQAYRALQGGLIGGAVNAAATSAFATTPITGAVTSAAAVSGFTTGAFSGWLLGTAESSYIAEKGSFALELAKELDQEGNPLSLDTIEVASTAYAVLSAVIEVAGERLFIGALGSQGLKVFIKSTVKKALSDKKYGGILLDGLIRIGANAAGQGAEEAGQEAVAILTTYLAKSYENNHENKNFQNDDIFTGDNGKQIAESFKTGFLTSVWLQGLPIAGAAGIRAKQAKDAKNFYDSHVNFHNKLSETNENKIAPENLQSILERSGKNMLEKVTLPADAALELYRNGTDILSPLGITESDAIKNAELGSFFSVPISKMHAFLDKQQFEAAAQIMTRDIDSISLSDDATTDSEIDYKTQKIIDIWKKQEEDFQQMQEAKEGLRQEASAAVNNSMIEWSKNQPAVVEALVNTLPEDIDPSLKNINHVVENYVDDWLGMLEKHALRMAAAGVDAVETFKRLSIKGLQNELLNTSHPVSLQSSLENTFFQNPNANRGSLQKQGENWVISLFKNADPSTLIHETAHVFFEDLEQSINLGTADKSIVSDYGILKKWFSRFNDEQILKKEFDFSIKNHPLFKDKLFENLSNEEKSKVKSIAEKEYFARGFEAFLLEGAAPSKELEGMFKRFRNWLLAVYRDIRNLNVELDDSVRSVFERMLVADEDIANAAALNEMIGLTNKELDALGIKGTEREYAQKLMIAARETAAQNLEQSRSHARTQRLQQFAKEAKEEIYSDPLYLARANMQKTPIDANMAKILYGEDIINELRKKLPFALKEASNVDPEIFALSNGFKSGIDLISKIIEAPTLKKAIENRVKEKEDVYTASFNPVEYLIETAQANEQISMVGKYIAKSLGQEHIEQKVFSSIAEKELAAMPLGKAIQTNSFLAAMRRALRQERMAIAKGDFKAALDANYKARINIEFARNSRHLNESQEKMSRKIKRFVAMHKANPDARFIVMDIGMRYGFSKYNARLAENRDASTTSKWIANVSADGYTVYVDDAILYGTGKPWREMSFAEFDNLTETINQVITIERNQRQLLTDKNKLDVDTAANNIAESIYTYRKPKPLKTIEKESFLKRTLQYVHAVHMKIESLCIALDGDKHGLAWEYIYLPLANAENGQSIRLKEVKDKLSSKGLFGSYSRKDLVKMVSKKNFVKEIGENITFENRISVALNLGNESNINRLREGHSWNDEQIAAIVKPLKKKDWEFVQNVWDYIGSFKEEAFALQETISGIRPATVEPQAFTVTSVDGHSINLRGGYYPIKYNSDKSFRVFSQEQKAMDNEFFGGRNYGMAMTKHGHLKDRAKGGMGSPLLLELSVITDHIFNVVHDVSHRKAILDVAKIIRHKKIREAIEATVGKDIYKELTPWLQNIANERQEPLNVLQRLFKWARTSSSILTMGYKFTTMFAQPMGFTQSIDMIGYKWAGKGLKHVYKNPLKIQEILEDTFNLSPFMANRIKSFDREVKDLTGKLKPSMTRFAWVDKIRDNAFVPMGIFQMGVDLPTWWGAFEKGLNDFKGDEKQAVQYADSIVRLSQGSGSAKDLARVQRGDDMWRLLTMYYSYFNTLYNLGARGITALRNDLSPAGLLKAANTSLLLWFLPAVLSEILAGRGASEDEDPVKWATMNVLQYPFQSLIVVRDFSNAIFSEYDYEITAANAAPKSIITWIKAINKALEEEDENLLIKPTIEAASYITQLPTKQAVITLGNLWDYFTDEDPDFYVRDLFFTKPKHRR